MSLGWKLVSRFFLGLLCFALIFFGTAGSLRFWEAWEFLAAWFIPGLIFCVYFYKRDPEFIRRRMQSKEKETEQKWIMRAAFSVFLAAFLMPGLDFRFGWSKRWLGAVPVWLQILSLAVVLCAYLMVLWVFDVNRYAARTIQVESGQRVISAGPYRWVRHPMYLGSLVMLLFAPLALGSYVALPVFTLTAPVYIFRLLNEESVLRRELAGYSEYCATTRYHLVPYLW